MSGQQVDPRFTYANERTFLAWVRTAVALIAAGVAAVQFLPDLDGPGGRRAVGVAFVALGVVVCVAARRQWADNERAMQDGAPLPRSRMVPLVTVGVTVLGVVVAVLSVLGT